MPGSQRCCGRRTHRAQSRDDNTQILTRAAPRETWRLVDAFRLSCIALLYNGDRLNLQKRRFNATVRGRDSYGDGLRP